MTWSHKPICQPNAWLAHWDRGHGWASCPRKVIYFQKGRVIGIGWSTALPMGGWSRDIFYRSSRKIIRLVIDKWIDDGLMTQWPEMMIQCSSSPMGSLGLQVERFLKLDGQSHADLQCWQLAEVIVSCHSMISGQQRENPGKSCVIPCDSCQCVIVSFGRASHWAGVEDFGVRDDLLRRLKHETAQAVASNIGLCSNRGPPKPKTRGWSVYHSLL